MIRNIFRYKEQKAKRYVTLNEAKFLKERAEMNADKEEEKAIENARPTGGDIKRDYYLDEVLAIAADYMNLQHLAECNPRHRRPKTRGVGCRVRACTHAAFGEAFLSTIANWCGIGNYFCGRIEGRLRSNVGRPRGARFVRQPTFLKPLMRRDTVLTRQKILLALLGNVRGSLSPTVFVKMVFLLRQETALRSDPTFYDFVPYKYRSSFPLVCIAS